MGEEASDLPGTRSFIKSSALQRDLFALNEYFLLWYFSRESPPQDLKQRELTFLSPASTEKKKKGRDTDAEKGEVKTREGGGGAGGMGELEER